MAIFPVFPFQSFLSDHFLSLKKSMQAAILVVSPDSEHLQRLDPELLSDQALMEMFVEGFNRTSWFQDANRNFTDISEWPQVHVQSEGVVDFTTNEDDEDVDELSSFYEHHSGKLGGSLFLQFLPKSMKWLTVSDQDLSGTIDTSALGPNMEFFNLDRNSFEGSFLIEKLPQLLIAIDISHNKMIGTLNIASLPRNMQEFIASNNNFEGTIDLDNLPEYFEELDLSDNRLTGSVNFHNLKDTSLTLRLGNNRGLYGALFTSALPPRTYELSLSQVNLKGSVHLSQVMRQAENFQNFHFSAFDVPKSVENISLHVGTVDFTRLPKDLSFLKIEHCSLEGTANFQKLPKELESLMISNNRLLGSVEYTQKEGQMERIVRIDMSHNAFSGDLDLSKLPKSLLIFKAAHNSLSGCVDFEKMHKRIDQMDISHNAKLSGETERSGSNWRLQALCTEGTKIVRNDAVFCHIGADA